MLGPVIGPGTPPPPSGYSGVLGGVKRQDGSGFAVRVWCMVPFLLRLCVCDWPGGLSLPLSSPVSVVTSSPGPPERGLLWDGGNNSLCVREDTQEKISNLMMRCTTNGKPTHIHFVFHHSR